MTLSTNVYVLDKVELPTLFRRCQEILQRYDEDGRTPDQQVWSDAAAQIWVGSEWVDDPSGRRRRGNRLGQGLPALLEIEYRVGGALPAHDDLCDEDCTGEYHRPTGCWADVDFDTTYGYRDAQGRGCGDLHALLVAELGKWLTEQGIRWLWRNEFTCEVHDGPERLVDLVSGGFEAAAWFRTSVLPAILAEAAVSDGH